MNLNRYSKISEEELENKYQAMKTELPLIQWELERRRKQRRKMREKRNKELQKKADVIEKLIKEDDLFFVVNTTSEYSIENKHIEVYLCEGRIKINIW